MPQEAITEIDMDVYSRRIGPYFSWIESKIEGGWTQSESVQKDVLKEAKYLATTMRARFILGVSKGDFSKEVQRTLELFELSLDAFPEESDEVEAKIRHFVKGVSEELGAEFIPASYREPLTPQPPMPDPYPGPEPMPGPEPLEPGEPDEEKTEIKTVRAESIKKIKIEKIKKSAEKEKKMLMNCSCLVSDENYTKLGDVLETIEKEYGLSVRFTGPWPVYSFV
jgi:hypothetical protein